MVCARRAFLSLLALLVAPLGIAHGNGEKPYAADTTTRIEAAYSDRAGEELRLFGYDFFASGPGDGAPVLGIVQDDHVLGVGDILQITLRGQISESRVYPVGSDGTVIIDRLHPIHAAGRSLGQVRAEISAAVGAAHLQTEAFVSLASVRRISVLVAGEVGFQGRHELSAFSTLLDALFAAGGVRRTGSLRAIRVIKPGAPPEIVDLYGLMTGDDTATVSRLPDGTRIVVPPLGPTVAVAGGVKRPGIFELRPDAAFIGMEDLLELAGGPLQPGPQRSVRLGFGPEGAEVASPVPTGGTVRLSDGDILLFAADRLDRTGAVELVGRVHLPGTKSLKAGRSISRLVRKTDLREDAYLPMAILERRDGTTGSVEYLPVNLAAILDGTGDMPLADGNAVIILGREDVAYLASSGVIGLLAGRRSEPTTDCAGLAALAAALSADPGGSLSSGPLARSAALITGSDQPCPPLFADRPDLLPYLLGQSVLLRHGVLRPGPYPAAPDFPKAGLVEAAGGRVDGPLKREVGGDHAGVLDTAPARVELTGAVLLPGTRRLAEAPTLRVLLGDGRVLANDAYGLFAVIERFDPSKVQSTLIPFSPSAVIRGDADEALRDRDRVHILDRAVVETLTTEPAVAVDVGDRSGPAADADAPPAGEEAGRPATGHGILGIARDSIVTVRGAVAREGGYPVAKEAELGEIVAAAGGLRQAADPDAIEITPALTDNARPRRVAALGKTGARVAPGDAVRVPPAPRGTEPGTALIEGEVMRPGWFDLGPGETLSSLLQRAGGLTSQAYPDGAVFIRASARRAEESGLRRAAAELDRGLALALLRQNPPDSGRVELVRQLSDALRTAPALGRITVEADPAVLAARPELDILLEPGDRIVIPKRPLTVTVSGEVLSPASLQFSPGKTLETYLREAGGLTRYADSGRIFVLLPDGSSQPARGLAGRHSLRVIPPGSIIVVPRDPEPFDFLPMAQNVATILGQLAITAVAVTALTGE